jgi:hypothetical protein
LRGEHLAGGEVIDRQPERIADRHHEFQVVRGGLSLLTIYFQVEDADGMAAQADRRRNARHPPTVRCCRARQHGLVGPQHCGDHSGGHGG